MCEFEIWGIQMVFTTPTWARRLLALHFGQPLFLSSNLQNHVLDAFDGDQGIASSSHSQ
jgi:hypothetical protein